MASNRSLAAIMFTDLVGYTAMMEEDEAKALSALRTNRAIHKKYIKKHHGTFLKEMGDGILARFPSASDAVYCAAAILRESQQQDIILRIGMHLGEIVEENGDVFGDGVNVASRIESIAELGSIYISDSIEKNVRNKTGISSEFIGDESLKNVADPVSVYKVSVETDVHSLHKLSDSGNSITSPINWKNGVIVLALLATIIYTGWIFSGDVKENKNAEPTIAVLPFETISGGEVNSFTKGIQSGLLTRLSNVSGLKVTSRTSTLQYQEHMKSIADIANELKVDWIVRGEVQETPGQVQVNARLIFAPEDRQVWAKDYRRQLTATNLFDIQSDLAKQIARELQTRISPEEQGRLERHPTDNLIAYRHYAQGLTLLEQRTPTAMLKSVDYFMKAISEDSTYAPAWAVLGETLIYIENYGYDSLDNYNVKPQQAINTALSYNPFLAEAHASLGIMRYIRKDGPGAVEALKKAIELQPSYETAQNWLGFITLLLGRPGEALEYSRRAIELNPLAPASRLYPSLTYLANGEGKLALAEARRAREIQPGWGEVYAIEGIILYNNGQYEEAKKSLLKADSLITPTQSIWIPDISAMLALSYAATGDFAKARNYMEDISPMANIFWKGLVQAALNNNEEAFSAFQQIEEFSMWPNLSLRYFFPNVLEPLRKDPRFESLLHEMNRHWGLPATS